MYFGLLGLTFVKYTENVGVQRFPLSFSTRTSQPSLETKECVNHWAD